MSAEAARRALSMTLWELVNRYLSLAGSFGVAVPLGAFGFSPAETERLFSAYDEDYHISRFFRFTEAEGAKFTVNSEPATHVALDGEIQSIL